MTDTHPETIQPDADMPSEATSADAETNITEPAEKDWAAEYQALHDQHLRLAADFENFRKRTNTDREALLKYGAANTIEMLLPVLDNLELGASSLSASSDPNMLYQSFTMLAQQLLTALEDVGLKKLTPLNQPFDPAIHEAIAQEPSDSAKEGTILRVQKSGYALHDRTLRPAQVVVAASQTPAGDAPAEANGNFEATPGGNNPFATSDN